MCTCLFIIVTKPTRILLTRPVIVPPAPYHDELTAHDPNFSVDPQVIVEALQRGSPLMSMSSAQLWHEIGNARERSLSFEARLPGSKLVGVDNLNLNKTQQSSSSEEQLEKHRFESAITETAANEPIEPLVASTEVDIVVPNQEQAQTENMEAVAKDQLPLIDGNESLVEPHKETGDITPKPVDQDVSMIVESSSLVATVQAQPASPKSSSPPRNDQTSLSDRVSDEADQSTSNIPTNEVDNAGCESLESPESFHSSSDVETEHPEGVSVSAAHAMELDSYTVSDFPGDKTDAVRIEVEVTNVLEQTGLDASLPSMGDMDSHTDIDLNGAAATVPAEADPIEIDSTPPEPTTADYITSQLVVTETMPLERGDADTASYIQDESERTNMHVVDLYENLPNELDLSKAKEDGKRAQSETGHSEGDLNEQNRNQDSVVIPQEVTDSAVTAVAETKEPVPEKAVPEETVSGETIPEKAVPEETIPEKAVPEETMTEGTMPEKAGPERAASEAVPEQAGPEQAAPVQAVPEAVVPKAVAVVPEVALSEEAVLNEATLREGKPNGEMDNTHKLSTSPDTLEPMKDLVVPPEYSPLASVLKVDNAISIAKNLSGLPGTPDIDSGQIPAYSDSVINEKESGSPPNNDLCLVCNSTTFIGAESNSIVGQSSGDSTLKWIECDNCKCWTHNACVSLSNEEVDMIDKYHCAMCEKEKGPSTCKSTFTKFKIFGF